LVTFTRWNNETFSILETMQKTTRTMQVYEP
jgi:hypothetical protein